MMQIEHWDPERDGALSESAMRRKLEDRGYVVSRYVYPPGTWFPDHEHGVDKIDGVLSGRFRMTMRGQSAVLDAGTSWSYPSTASTAPRWSETSPWSAWMR
jgi:quercetin dioxygenase-like cupin family protein